jgi:Ca-activated chloride channel family protein
VAPSSRHDLFVGLAKEPNPEELCFVYTVPKGRTALLDAICQGLSKMRDAKFGEKTLLMISDGGGNHSRYTESEIRNLVKESDVQIYAIGIYDHYFQTQEERLVRSTAAERHH